MAETKLTYRQIQNPVATLTSGATLDDTYSVVLADASSGAFTITLPTASGRTGRFFTVNRIDSALTNLVTIATTSSETIDGVLNVYIGQRFQPITFISDGTNWFTETKPNADLFAYRCKGSTLNRWYSVANTTVALTTTAPSVNNLRATPFVVPKTITIDQMAINCTAAGTSSNIRVGIYFDNGNNYPGALLVDAGANSTATTGVKTYTTNLPVTLFPGLYWMASVGDGTAPTLRAIASTGFIPILGIDSALGTAFGVAWQAGFTYGSLPSTFTSGGSVQTAAQTAIFYRLSA